jgi:hypothetical protein
VSDDIDHQVQDNTALLNRADTLLDRRKTAPVTAIPVLTEVASSAAVSIDTTTIPTLTEIVTLQPSAMPTNDAILQLPGQTLEQIVYRKLKSQFDQNVAGMSQQLSAPEVAAAFDQALRQLSGNLKMDIDAMVRASVKAALRSPNNAPQDALTTTPIPPDSPTPK